MIGFVSTMAKAGSVFFATGLLLAAGSACAQVRPLSPCPGSDTPFLYELGQLALPLPYTDCDDELGLAATRRYALIEAPPFETDDSPYVGIVVERSPYSVALQGSEVEPRYTIAVHYSEDPREISGADTAITVQRTTKAFRADLSRELFLDFEAAIQVPRFLRAAKRDEQNSVWASHQRAYFFDFHRGSTRHAVSLNGDEAWQPAVAPTTRAFRDLAARVFPELGARMAVVPERDHEENFQPLLAPDGAEPENRDP